MPPAIDGGGAFFGFIDFGNQISSVTFNATNDILCFDDLRFGNAENNPNIPEPRAIGGLLGFGLLGFWRVAKKRHGSRRLLVEVLGRFGSLPLNTFVEALEAFRTAMSFRFAY